MAAANRHIEGVRELLNVDMKICCVEGRDNQTPLHFAAVKGRVDVIDEILSCCAECIKGVTVEKKTCLHHVKNSQFGAIKFMVIELLLGCGTTSSVLMEVNAANQCGLTALDVLQMFPSKAGDREIAEVLQRAGAVRARDLLISPFPSYESSDGVINQPGT
ncbi:uncharacterized protein LOC120140933 [Hibiscus syriacus]|uniref:uncharacterized protein LOC120140933 n=1 Tax=Hibiscus syriacus TaxID=106335 RepID=UPI00192187B7|nr:uncharacterized protein LOC120140933 [Hibiscus syriacus]